MSCVMEVCKSLHYALLHTSFTALSVRSALGMFILKICNYFLISLLWIDRYWMCLSGRLNCKPTSDVWSMTRSSFTRPNTFFFNSRFCGSCSAADYVSLNGTWSVFMILSILRFGLWHLHRSLAILHHDETVRFLRSGFSATHAPSFLYL